jgi:serine protease Do
MSWRNSSLGVEAESLGETQLADYFGVKQGVLVRSVIKGTAAEKAGLKAGDVLVKVDATPVSTPRDITNALRASRTAGKTALPVALVREHKDMTLQVAMPEVKSPAPAVRGERVSHRGL